MTDGRRHTRVEPLPGDCVVRSKDGEPTEHPQYHTVICWDRLAEQTGKHVTKGRLVLGREQGAPLGRAELLVAALAGVTRY
jgi:hypothetical protein